jgi:Do/DeqQ family serine protease
MNNMKRLTVIVVSAMLGGLAVLGGAHWLGWPGADTVTTPGDTPVVQFANYTPSSKAGAAISPEGFTVAAEKAVPAVVHIKAAKRSRLAQGPGMDLEQLPPMFRDFFGPRGFEGQGEGGEMPLQEGSGSGVIISSDGYIVTNNHVVEDAETLDVVLNDESTYTGEVIGVDPTTDIALIKIDAAGLPSVKFADSDQVRVGEWVVAVGNPFSLTSTVTAGIVSAKGRGIGILRRQSEYAIESFIQTDAVVNPGNSGGALVNTSGDLIGINTAISSPTGVYAGYAFAVPSKIVAKVVEDLKEYGVVQRAFLGARIRQVDAEFAEAEGLERDNGVYISEVTDGSAAEAADLAAGDVIIAVDGRSTLRSSQLLEQLGRKRPGDQVTLKIVRNGQERDVPVTLKNQAGTETVVTAQMLGQRQAPELGARLEELDQQTAEKLDLTGGVRIADLDKNGLLAQQTDIQPGFIITKIDKRPVRSPQEVQAAVRNADGGLLIEGRYPDRDRTYYYGIGME